MATQDLKDRVVLVTGASRGIGAAIAFEAGSRGAHVVAVARATAKLEELDDRIQKAGGSTTLVPLNVTDYAGIDRVGAALFERWGRLDGLVGNAAMLGAISPVPHLEPKLFERTVATNVTANYRLIRAFDPLLRLSDAGRTVFISSGAASNARPYWGLYAATKAGLNALVKSYAGEMEKLGVTANVIYPGQIRTAMRAQAVPGEDPMTLPTPESIAPAIVDLLLPGHTGTGMIHDLKAGTVREI